MWRLCRSAPSAGEKRFWTCTTFPTFQHSGFYFPPAASKDRAVNGIEIKDFMILWSYSQWRRDLVFIPPFSPEREMCCILPLIGFRMLILCKKQHSISFLQSANIARSLAAGLPSWMWPDQFSYQSYVSACQQGKICFPEYSECESSQIVKKSYRNEHSVHPCMIFTTSEIRIYKQMSLNALYAIVYGFILRFPSQFYPIFICAIYVDVFSGHNTITGNPSMSYPLLSA